MSKLKLDFDSLTMYPLKDGFDVMELGDEGLIGEWGRIYFDSDENRWVFWAQEGWEATFEMVSDLSAFMYQLRGTEPKDVLPS